MSSRQEKFASEIYQAARRAGLNDVQARLAASQASLETGYGKSVKGNNLFGIKAGKSWKGKTQSFKTWEDYGKGRVNIIDKFRSYNKVEDSIKDWSEVVKTRFPKAWNASDFDTAAKSLISGKRKYATDTKYDQKLKYISRKFLGDNPKGGFVGNAGIDESLQPPPTPKANPDFRYAAIPKARPDDKPTMVADLAPRKVATTRIGPDPRDIAERSFAKSWDTPSDLQSQFARAREAMGLSSGEAQPPTITPSAPVLASSAPTASRQTQKPLSDAQARINSVWARVPDEKTPTVSQVGGAPAIRPGYNRDESRAKTAQSRIDRTFAQIPTQKPQTRTVKTVEYKPTRVQITPKGKAKSSGMTLDNVGDFAPGPTSMNVRQMNADAFGVAPTPAPLPRAKPQYKTVMKPVVKYAQIPVTPRAKPAMQPVQQQKPQSLFSRMFSPSGMIGGIAGNMIGGPVGGLVGNLAARGISNSVNHGGGATGGFANGAHDDGRRYNPTQGHYVDSTGNRSSDQSLGSGGSFATIKAIANKASRDFGGGSSGGGGCFITTAAVDVMGEADTGDTLQTLRWFRDNVMLKNPDWAKDVEEYYNVAPSIVERLNGDEDIYRQIYKTALRPAANAVKEANYELAYKLYKSMVGKLMRPA